MFPHDVKKSFHMKINRLSFFWSFVTSFIHVYYIIYDLLHTTLMKSKNIQFVYVQISFVDHVANQI